MIRILFALAHMLYAVHETQIMKLGHIVQCASLYCKTSPVITGWPCLLFGVCRNEAAGNNCATPCSFQTVPFLASPNPAVHDASPGLPVEIATPKSSLEPTTIVPKTVTNLVYGRPPFLLSEGTDLPVPYRFPMHSIGGTVRLALESGTTLRCGQRTDLMEAIYQDVTKYTL